MERELVVNRLPSSIEVLENVTSVVLDLLGHFRVLRDDRDSKTRGSLLERGGGVTMAIANTCLGPSVLWTRRRAILSRYRPARGVPFSKAGCI